VFPITYASALLTLAASAYLFRKRIGLSWIRSLILGAGLGERGCRAVRAALAGNGIPILPQSITGGVWLANYVLNGSWIFLSFGSIQYWKISRKFLITGIAFVAGWVVWIGLGFPQVFPSAVPVALVMNSSLKVLSFVLLTSLVIFKNKDITAPDGLLQHDSQH